MDIVFQLVRGKECVSKVIGYFGGGYYSHVDTVTPAGLLRGARSDVILGIPAGVQDRPQNYEKWDRCTRYTLDARTDQCAAFWWFMDQQVGKPYDKRGLIDTFVIGREWRDDGSWWCSELVAAALEKAAFIPTLPLQIKAVSPGDVAFILAGLGAKVLEL